MPHGECLQALQRAWMGNVSRHLQGRFLTFDMFPCIPPESPPAREYSLSTEVVRDGTVPYDAVNNDAVKKIQNKKGFNLKKMIGKALARQVEGLLLSSDRLTIGEPLGEGICLFFVLILFVSIYQRVSVCSTQ